MRERSLSSDSLRPSPWSSWFGIAARGFASTAAPRLATPPRSTSGGTLCTPRTGGPACRVDLIRLVCDPQPSQEPTQQAAANASDSDGDYIRERLPLPSSFRPASGRYWYHECSKTHNPRSADPPSRAPTVQIGRAKQPQDLVHGRKGETIPFPQAPSPLQQPRLPPRVESRPLRGCLCLPAMVLPESYPVGPAFARAYYKVGPAFARADYMGNDNKMHCLLPCSNEPFCPFHSACGAG